MKTLSRFHAKSISGSGNIDRGHKKPPPPPLKTYKDRKSSGLIGLNTQRKKKRKGMTRRTAYNNFLLDFFTLYCYDGTTSVIMTFYGVVLLFFKGIHA